MKTILCALLLIGCSVPSSQGQLHQALARQGSGTGCPSGYEPNPDFDPTSDDPEWQCILTGETATPSSDATTGSFQGGGSGAALSGVCFCSQSLGLCGCTGTADCSRLLRSGRCDGSSCRYDQGGYHCTCPDSGNNRTASGCTTVP